MILTIDMGNTNIFVGFYQDGQIVQTFRTLTDYKKSYDEYLLVFKEFVEKKGIEDAVEGAVLSSVVPSLTVVIQKAIRDAFHTNVIVVTSGVKTGLPVRIDNPQETGADLVADCVGALSKYGPATLVVDLGTASKILVVDKSGAFVGGVVMPGIKISAQALTGNTAQLPDISLVAPENVIGKNTPDCMNSGSVYGTIASIEGLCKKIESELGYKCNLIITGGYAPIIKDKIDTAFVYDRNLILDGLYQIYLKNLERK